jgi:hypothetical protein
MDNMDTLRERIATGHTGNAESKISERPKTPFARKTPSSVQGGSAAKKLKKKVQSVKTPKVYLCYKCDKPYKTARGIENHLAKCNGRK